MSELGIDAGSADVTLSHGTFAELAFDAKRYSEAEAICGDEGLRAKLSLLKSGDVPLCGDNAILDVRLAHPDEAALYRQAAGASQSTDDLMLVYLVARFSQIEG